MFTHMRAMRVAAAVVLITTGAISIHVSGQSRGSANRSPVAPRNEHVKAGRRSIRKVPERYFG